MPSLKSLILQFEIYCALKIETVGVVYLNVKLNLFLEFFFIN